MPADVLKAMVFLLHSAYRVVGCATDLHADRVGEIGPGRVGTDQVSCDEVPTGRRAENQHSSRSTERDGVPLCPANYIVRCIDDLNCNRSFREQTLVCVCPDEVVTHKVTGGGGPSI